MAPIEKGRKVPRTLVSPSQVQHEVVLIGRGSARIVEVCPERILYEDEEGVAKVIDLECYKDRRPCRVGSKLLQPWAPVDEPEPWIMIAGELGYVKFVFESAGGFQLERDLAACDYMLFDRT